MKRNTILDAAKEIISGKRNETYGAPENSFAQIAELWEVYLRSSKHMDVPELSAHDVAIMMALMKIARTYTKPHSDNYIDAVGYLAIAGELSAKEDEPLLETRMDTVAWGHPHSTPDPRRPSMDSYPCNCATQIEMYNPLPHKTRDDT